MAISSTLGWVGGRRIFAKDEGCIEKVRFPDAVTVGSLSGGRMVVCTIWKGSSQTPLDSCRIEGRGGEAEQSGGRLIIGDGGEKITFIYHFHWVTN